MGCGYSKQTPEGGRVAITMQSFHQVRLQGKRKCNAPAILHVDATPSKKMSMYESTEEEDLLQCSDDHSKPGDLEATAKVIGVMADAGVLVEKPFKVIPIAYIDNETNDKLDLKESEMQMKRPETHLQADKGGDENIQLDMIEDAERISNVTCCNEGEPAKKILDGAVKISAIKNNRKQSQELKDGSENKLQEAVTKEEIENDVGESDGRTSQIDGPPSFRIYCVQPSQENEQEEEEGDDCVYVDDKSDEYPEHQKRSSGNSFGSILSVSSWSSHQVADTNVKKQGRKKKFAKAIMGGSVAMRNLLSCNAGNCSHSHRIDHVRGRIMAARVAIDKPI